MLHFESSKVGRFSIYSIRIQYLRQATIDNGIGKAIDFAELDDREQSQTYDDQSDYTKGAYQLLANPHILHVNVPCSTDRAEPNRFDLSALVT